MHKRALETREPSCVPRAAKYFFIPMVHRPLGVVGDVAASELSPWGSRARSHGTRRSARAQLSREARSKTKGHVAMPELSSVRRRGPGPRDTWWSQSPPLLGGVVQTYNIHGSTWMHALLLLLT
jgi:hypothetical protein